MAVFRGGIDNRVRDQLQWAVAPEPELELAQELSDVEGQLVHCVAAELVELPGDKLGVHDPSVGSVAAEYSGAGAQSASVELRALY